VGSARTALPRSTTRPEKIELQCAKPYSRCGWVHSNEDCRKTAGSGGASTARAERLPANAINAHAMQHKTGAGRFITVTTSTCRQ
jgi:hypothetical protein